jgi:hypothetical protein
MLGQDAGPDDVDLHQIDVRGLGTEELKVLGQTIRGTLGAIDKFNVDAGLLLTIG